jgi:hypothetical protein
MAGVATVAGITKGAEGFKSFREATAVVGFVRISRHSGILKPQDKAYKSVRKPRVVFSLM